MKVYFLVFALLALTALAACGGTQQVVVVTSTPAPTVAPTVNVNAVQTQAAASIYATQTAAAPAAAPAAASTAASSGNASFITGVVMATSTQGDNFDPVGVTTVFPPDSTFHAVVTIIAAPDSSKIKAIWYAVDVGNAAPPNTLIDQYELTTNGSRNLDFSLKPTSTWAQGTYRVDIYGNGTLAQSVKFQVQAAGSQAPSTPAPAAGASFVTQVALATSTQGDNFDPVGVTTSLRPTRPFTPSLRSSMRRIIRP